MALPSLILGLVVPIARGLGVVASVPIPALALASALAGPLLVAVWPRLAGPLPASLDRWFDPGNRRLAALWAALAVLALVMTGRLAVFLADPSEVAGSIVPDEPFLVRHSCLTAYMHGAILSLDPAANVYDLAFVETVADAPAPLPPTAAHFAPFTLDAYGYPPPFLLLPRALLLVSADFLSQRLLFAAASLLLLLGACAAAARTLGGVAERRIWLLTPLLIGNLPVLATLQVGNFHLAALALCILCWVTLERRRDGLAGGLLAAATLAKIFPGLLGVILLMQRRWRAVAWTIALALVLCGLSVLVVGTKVWHDFLFYHLANVQSGEALRFLAGSPREITFNIAPFGVPFKLDALGLDGWGWPEARRINAIFTGLLFVVAVIAGRVKAGPRHRLIVWLAIVMLASLRSPYAAPFVLSTLLVLLMVLAAEVRSWRGVVALIAAWAALTIQAPIDDLAVAMVVSLIRCAALYAFLVWAALRREVAGG